MDESLDTREFLSKEILCAEKSIKDFSCIQTPRTFSSWWQSKSIDFDETSAVTNHAPQKLIVFEGRQESELAKILEVLRHGAHCFFDYKAYIKIY